MTISTADERIRNYWRNMQLTVNALADSMELGDLLAVVGRTDRTRVWYYTEGTVCLSKADVPTKPGLDSEPHLRHRLG